MSVLRVIISKNICFMQDVVNAPDGVFSGYLVIVTKGNVARREGQCASVRKNSIIAKRL